MLITPRENQNESLVQVTFVFGVSCYCGYLMVHIWVAAVGTAMTSVVVPSMCVAVVLISVQFGGSY